MTTNEESKPLANMTGIKEEQIRILKKQRFELLAEIHDKQQALDRLDYKIYEMKKTVILFVSLVLSISLVAYQNTVPDQRVSYNLSETNTILGGKHNGIS